MDRRLPIAVSGFFTPSRTLGGELIEWRPTEQGMPCATLDVIPEPSCTWVVSTVPAVHKHEMRWLDDELFELQDPCEFVRQLWLLAMRSTETIVAAPHWWEGLSSQQQHQTCDFKTRVVRGEETRVWVEGELPPLDWVPPIERGAGA